MGNSAEKIQKKAVLGLFLYFLAVAIVYSGGIWYKSPPEFEARPSYT